MNAPARLRVGLGYPYSVPERQTHPPGGLWPNHLPPDKASPTRLLKLIRQYWGSERGLHYRRDVTLREDATRLSVGALGWPIHDHPQFVYALGPPNFPLVITKRTTVTTKPPTPSRILLIFPFSLFWQFSHESSLLFCGISFPHLLQYLLILLLLLGWQGIN